MIAGADRLRDKAAGYELNVLAARDRGDEREAAGWVFVALVLHEVADALDPLDDEDEAA